MKSYETSIGIKAPVEAVWRVLTEDMPRDPIPFGILKIEGDIVENARIKLWSEVSPERAFVLKVAVLDPPQRMVWRSRMPFGLFAGTRTFDLSAVAQTTEFQMREVFSGALSGIIVKSIPDLTPSFQKFANALKNKAETHA